MFFYHKNGKKFGPVSIDSLHAIVRTGVITLHDRVSQPGSAETHFAWQVIQQYAPESDLLNPSGKQRDDDHSSAHPEKLRRRSTRSGNGSSDSNTTSGGQSKCDDSDPTFEISHSKFGSPIVRFHCPNCDVKLRASVEEVGDLDSCPECRQKFVTPGPSRKVIDDLLKAVEQKRKAARATGVKAVKGIGTTATVIAVSAAAIATVYYLYLVTYWLTNVVSENIILILTVGSLFLVAALIIGLILAVFNASDGKSGVDNPLMMILLLAIFIPVGPFGWLLLAFIIGAGNDEEA